MSESDSTWVCCEEWCESGHEPHDETCPEHALEITKGFFASSMAGVADAAIRAYLILTDADDMEPDENALDGAQAEAEEAAACFAGIGSCGRGWCDHS